MRKQKSIVLLFAVALLISVFCIGAVMTSADEAPLKPQMSITMADGLVFNIYVPQSENLKNVAVDTKNVNVADLPIKDGHYHIRVPLDACDADREVKLSVSVADGEKTDVCEFTLSIAKYAEKLLSANESDTTKKLIKDILAYVNSSKKFFGKDESAEMKELLGDYESAFAPNTAENLSIGLKSATFVLGAKPSVRFYVSDGYGAADFTFKRGDEVLKPKTGSDERGEYLEIFSNAYAMIETLTYIVEGAEGIGKYNLSSYCDYVKNTYNESDKELLLDLCEKFYIYCESAAAYRKEVIISMCEHEYTSSVKKKATPTKEGIMEYCCSKCSHSYEERIPTTLKLLAIGNSFSEDAFAHMYIIAKNAGIENVVLGNLYRGGCSLDTHYKNMSGDLAEYQKFYVSSDSEQKMIVESTDTTAKHAITYTDWDYISIQQASKSSGLPEKYEKLQGVIEYINANKTGDAEILWHMTWAYQQDSTHTGFANYGNNQMTMYNGIVSTVQEKILTNSDIMGVIPSGTAIQNLRTSILGDTLTRDGYHLSLGIGRYTAALTWIAYITGCDVDKISATPANYPEVATYLDHIKDAVKKAIATPYSVTESAYPKDDDLVDTTLSPLTAGDIEYLISKGFDPDCYMLLDFDVNCNAFYNSTHSTNYARLEAQGSGSNQYMKWWSTQIFARDELITGSVIRLDAGYKYRPEGWIDMAKNTSRPGVVTADSSDSCVVVDDAWWGDYNYRAFNVGKSGGATFTQAEYEEYANDPSALTFKIYIPIAKRGELTAEDRAYLESLGLNPDEYRVIELEFTYNAYYNSTTGYGQYNDKSTSSNYQKYIATQVFSKEELTNGSIIRINQGYKYRPDGWTDLSTLTPKADRPGTVTTDGVIIDDAWWGDFNYRAFNINKTSGEVVTVEEGENFKIYVKIS